MKAHSASLINSVALVVIGLWDYIASQILSSTNMVPVAAGIILLFLYNGIKKEDKIIAHIAVVITLLVFLSLIKPFAEAVETNDKTVLIQNLILMLTGLLSIVYFVKSFIDARKNR
ncbi:MAG: hypothetical protein IH595_05995 [Bacteroidales bacterium]|nr:hypothetical protein [Bacteroidales bacterium]